MIDLPNVTFIAVTSIKIEETISALRYSCRGINPAEVVLVTDADVSPDGITVHKIPRINDITEFSKITVYDFPKYVNTDFLFLFQHDGFILNPEKWTDNFLEYDYIGAIWTDAHKFFDENGEKVYVGCGCGIRSRKVFSLPSELNLPWEPYQNNWPICEDSWICVKNRHIFEDHGCTFAPVELAVQFSHEQYPPLPVEEGITPFAFHGRGLLPKYKHLL